MSVKCKVCLRFSYRLSKKYAKYALTSAETSRTPWELRDVGEIPARWFSPTSRRSQGVPRSLCGGESEVYMCKKKSKSGNVEKREGGQRGGEDKEVGGRTKSWEGGQRGGNSAGVPIIFPTIVRLTVQTNTQLHTTVYWKLLTCRHCRVHRHTYL